MSSFVSRLGSIVRAITGGDLLRASGKPGCCCGDTCTCSNAPGCTTEQTSNTSCWRGSGNWTSGNNAVVLFNLAGLEQVTCCNDTTVIAPDIGLRESIEVEIVGTWLPANPGGCAGLAYYFKGSYQTVNGVETSTERTVEVNSSTCLVTGDNTTTSSFPTDVILLCGGDAQAGAGQPASQYPWFPQFSANIVHNGSGNWRSGCRYHESKGVFDAGPTGVARAQYRFTYRGYWDPNNDRCLDPTCSTACCLPDGGCRDDLDEGGCLAVGGVPWPGRKCIDAQCGGGPEVGACCDPATGACVQSTAGNCVPPRVFRGIRTVCSPNPCPQPTGACCTGPSFENCSLQTEASCLGNSGHWQGAGTTCSPTNPCAVNNPGACCHPDGTCTQVLNQSQCNGVFYMGGDCGIIDCQAQTGACCHHSAHGGVLTCDIQTQAECLALLNPVWLGPGTTCTPFPCGPPPGGAALLTAGAFL